MLTGSGRDRDVGAPGKTCETGLKQDARVGGRVGCDKAPKLLGPDRNGAFSVVACVRGQREREREKKKRETDRRGRAKKTPPPLLRRICAGLALAVHLAFDTWLALIFRNDHDHESMHVPRSTRSPPPPGHAPSGRVTGSVVGGSQRLIRVARWNAGVAHSPSKASNAEFFCSCAS